MNRLITHLFSLLIIFNLHSNTLDFTLTDKPFEYKGKIPQETYHVYCRNIYSQNGEDGLLEELFAELGIENGTFCEFGAADGIFSSNTYNLIKNHGFTGVAIESNVSHFDKLVENYKAFPQVQLFCGEVLYNDKNYDLDAWLKRANLDADFDLLSIDIDCDDYYVWQELNEFKPKIVLIETNSYRDPIYKELPRVPSQEYNPDLLRQWCPPRVALGCSFISAVELGLKKGYIPLSYTGNILFLRKDLVSKLKRFPYVLSENPYDYIDLYTHLVLWNNTWYTNTGLIYNVAIRDYYAKFQKEQIDLDWINTRMHEILKESGE